MNMPACTNNSNNKGVSDAFDGGGSMKMRVFSAVEEVVKYSYPSFVVILRTPAYG